MKGQGNLKFNVMLKIENLKESPENESTIAFLDVKKMKDPVVKTFQLEITNILGIGKTNSNST